jgi:hypothetical protein
MADIQNSPQNGASAQEKVQRDVISNPNQPESRRRLATANYAANSVVQVEIPRDTAIKRLNLFFKLGCTATYASGSPLLSPLGALAKICPSFSIVADGSRNVKVLDLYMARCMAALAYGGFGRRAYQTGASLLSSTSQPTTEWYGGASPAYGATTQDLIIIESIDVMFENQFAYERGRALSWLYTKNLATCNMYFGFASISNILQDGNAASVTYSNVDVSITPTIIEARDGTPANGAFDFTETVIRKQFSQQTTQFAVDLNTGNKLLGIGLMARNGDSNKSLSDIAVTDLNLVVNGATSIQNTKFRELSNANKQRFSMGDDYFASGTHGLQGFAYMNLMKNGDLLSGLDTRLVAGVSQVQLQVSTASSSGVDAATYTNPVELSVLQQQLIPVPPKA